MIEETALNESIFDELMAEYEDRVLVEKVKAILKSRQVFNPWIGPLMYAMVEAKYEVDTR